MCGIGAIFSFRKEGHIRHNNIANITNSLAHRGKDAENILYVSKNGVVDNHDFGNEDWGLSLGHRRLAIIDLDQNSDQPFTLKEDGLFLVYNGEIYNYLEIKSELEKLGEVFSTQSDTEVLIRSFKVWGESCLNKLRGIFSFAIWDQNKKELFCAVDQLGVKPLFYFPYPGGIAIASESRSLKTFHKNNISKDGVNSYLLGGYTAGTWSIFEGVFRLPAAHKMKIDQSGEIKVIKYWDIDPNHSIPVKTFDDAKAYFREKIEESIALQLRSDVKVGSFLSGGTDSGIIVSLAAQRLSKMPTYSVQYQGLGVNELPHAKKVADRYHTDHHEIILTPQDGLNYMRDALEASSEPVSDSALASTLAVSRKAQEKGVKVLLSGAGGDEIFGGYNRYTHWNTKIKLFYSMPEFLFKSILTLQGRGEFQKQEFLLRRKSCLFDMYICAGGNSQLLFEQIQDISKYSDFLVQTVSALGDETKLQDLVKKRMYADLKNYLPLQLNFLYDQATMATTIEGRVPLQDVTLVEDAYAVDSSFHFTKKEKKVLLKSICEPLIGTNVKKLPKQGFGGPIDYWVEHNKDEMISNLEYGHKYSWLNRNLLNSYIEKLKGNQDISKAEKASVFRLWSIITWANKNL